MESKTGLKIRTKTNNDKILHLTAACYKLNLWTHKSRGTDRKEFTRDYANVIKKQL